MVTEIAELWNQVNHQAKGMQILEDRLAESIIMNKELFSEKDSDWEFDKELECQLTEVEEVIDEELLHEDEPEGYGWMEEKEEDDEE